MSTELPTKPGPYYWRESDGDEWEIAQVNRFMDVYFIGCDMPYGLKETGGQWLPIPTAEELVELKATKKMVDEGQEAWAIYDTDGLFVVTDSVEPNTSFGIELKDGYTCRKVRVCMEVGE